VPSLLKRRGNALWYGRSVRSQLLIAFVLIDVVAVLGAGSVVILRARLQTRVEMSASMRLADLLVEDAVHLAGQELPAEQFLASLPAQLQSMRHVRFAVSDATGIPIAVKSPGHGTTEREAMPRWFAALVAPPVEMRDVAVTVDGQRIGNVAIIGEPADEIAEVWDNAVAMAVVAVLVNAVMIGLLYILFGRVLGPLTVLTRGLSDLEHQAYGVRLPQPQARELAAIAEHFNALAFALEALRGENLNLNRRLITAQDDERRRTALELHDEVGPCLFGLKANASSIESAAQNIPEQARNGVTERLHEILSIVDHLQEINRSMLDRLRPMALGHVPLKDMLGRLVKERAREHPHITFSLVADGLLPGYGDSIDLTIYRCVQESITNAIRHASAKRVTVTLNNLENGTTLALAVVDDGCGMSPPAPEGFGTRGMKERVEGLGGRYTVDSKPGLGTRVRITVPLVETAAAATASCTRP
jgi:two-component system, NarL family, sensor histidine kinase UhpB